jgi:hypothetical protein
VAIKSSLFATSFQLAALACVDVIKIQAITINLIIMFLNYLTAMRYIDVTSDMKHAAVELV